MKKLIALLLVAIMCMSFVACGGGETPNTDDNSGMQQETQNNESTDVLDYASEFTKILCSGKWVMRDEDIELSFREDGTFLWISDSENVNCTWSFVRYFDSFSEFPLAISNPEFSDDHCVYWGYGRDNNDIIIGYDDDGTLIMLHKNQYWSKVE